MKINIAIDATNIGSGGGFANLLRVVEYFDEFLEEGSEVNIWTNSIVAKKIPSYNWLIIHSPRWCNASFVRKFLTQQFFFINDLKRFQCDVLYSPGGTLPLRCNLPTVTMSQNLLPFELDRALLFGHRSGAFIKMLILRFLQSLSFRRADGIIFLTEYARQVVFSVIGHQKSLNTLIPHGIDLRFFSNLIEPVVTKESLSESIQLLYISVQFPYKHHIEVMEAVSLLHQQGVKLMLKIVGGGGSDYAVKIRNRRLQIDPNQEFIFDLGSQDYDDIHKLYASADIFIFASSCENLPNILIEAMASGLPIASSNRGPMPEVLKDAGVYFDPEDPKSIALSILRLIKDDELRKTLSIRSRSLAKAYSWERCAKDTLDFIVKVAKTKIKSS